MFIRPKNSKERLQRLGSLIINILSKMLCVDGQRIAALRSQLAHDPVHVLEHIAEILSSQRIEVLRDANDVKTQKGENHGF